MSDGAWPLTVVDVGRAERVDAAELERAGRAARLASPVLVGILRHGQQIATAGQRLLLRELDLTLVEGHHAAAAQLPLIEVEDVDIALQSLRAAVDSAPCASAMLTGLLRQTAMLDPDDGLRAESAVYSTLQAGPEFARWLAARGPARQRPESGRPRVRLAARWRRAASGAQPP